MQSVERAAFVLLIAGLIAALVVLALMLPPKSPQSSIFAGASLVRRAGGGICG